MSEPTNQETCFTPLDFQGNLLTVRAQCYDRSVDPNHVRLSFPKAIELSPSCWLLNQMPTNIVIIEFGAIVCWSADESVLAPAISLIEHGLGLQDARHTQDESLSVRLNENEESVTFREVRMKQMTREHLRLISEMLAKSTALRNTERVVDQTISQNSDSVKQLSERGTIDAPSKKLLKSIGFTLTMREQLLARLNVLDAPPETWQSERLYKLYEQLRDYFDFRIRTTGLQAKLKYLSDLSSTLLGFMDHREGKRLEWIVIILIVIEVIFSTIHFIESKM